MSIYCCSECAAAVDSDEEAWSGAEGRLVCHECHRVWIDGQFKQVVVDSNRRRNDNGNND